MHYLNYIAGFGPKDLMGLLYIPALGIIVLAMTLVLILKRGGRPYMLAMFIFPVALELRGIYTTDSALGQLTTANL